MHMKKYIKWIVVGIALLGIAFLITGCWATKEPPTANEVEMYLEDRYGEEFTVLEQKEMKANGKYYEIQAYQVCPAKAPQITFSTFYLEYENSLGGSIISEHAARMSTFYGSGIVRKEILDWLKRDGWDYKVRYHCKYSFESNNRKDEEQYATGMSVEIRVDDIENSRETIAEQLSVVLEKLIIAYTDKKVRIDNKTDYDIKIELCENGNASHTESIWIMEVGSEELEISKEGIIEKFKS